jgi:hypothetical protein
MVLVEPTLGEVPADALALDPKQVIGIREINLVSMRTTLDKEVRNGSFALDASQYAKHPRFELGPQLPVPVIASLHQFAHDLGPFAAAATGGPDFVPDPSQSCEALAQGIIESFANGNRRKLTSKIQQHPFDPRDP